MACFGLIAAAAVQCTFSARFAARLGRQIRELTHRAHFIYGPECFRSIGTSSRLNIRDPQRFCIELFKGNG